MSTNSSDFYDYSSSKLDKLDANNKLKSSTDNDPDAAITKSPALQIALDNKELFPGTPLEAFMANTKSNVWQYFCALKNEGILISICTVPKSDGSICATQFKGTFTTNLKGHLRV